MKPSKVASRRTKSPANSQSGETFVPSLPRAERRIAFLVVLIAMWLVPVSCAQYLISPANPPTLQQTVDAVSEIPNPQNQVIAAQSTSTDTPTQPAIPTRVPSPANTQPVPTPADTQIPTILYYTQAGDTLSAVADRFNVDPGEITSPTPLNQQGLLDPNLLLLIPPRLDEVSSSQPIIPDSEVVYSPSALDLNLEQFVADAGGYLSTYKEWRSYGWLNGPQVIHQVAIENSINPRVLMAVLEIQSHWVYGKPANIAETDFPIGFLHNEEERKGLYFQLSWAVQQMNIGYYGWRQGRITEVTFPDGKKLRLAPSLNAGTVGVLYLFSRLYNQEEWAGVLYGTEGMMQLYGKMFGNPWLRAQAVEPLFPATLTQPPLALPFLPGRTWSFTGGPHSAWGPDGARSALDFAPTTTVHGCYESDEWATAMAAGLVVRSENAVVVIDLDGDGYEQTGWNLMYLHMATKDRVKVGTWVNLNDPIGHPSCEGGNATGTHVHIARKYNGEWILADGPLPFNLSGWICHAGKDLYYGSMTQNDKTVTSSLVGEYFSLVTRPKE